jgi:hypothetical protein
MEVHVVVYINTSMVYGTIRPNKCLWTDHGTDQRPNKMSKVLDSIECLWIDQASGHRTREMSHTHAHGITSRKNKSCRQSSLWAILLWFTRRPDESGRQAITDNNEFLKYHISWTCLKQRFHFFPICISRLPIGLFSCSYKAFWVGRLNKRTLIRPSTTARAVASFFVLGQSVEAEKHVLQWRVHVASASCSPLATALRIHTSFKQT